MRNNSKLLEPSFADAINAVGQAQDSSDQRRRHWACSLSQIANWLERPLAVIPARWTSIRIAVAQLHHARVGVTAKTVANHKSNVRAALRWFGKEHDVPVRGVPLLVDWAKLRDRVEEKGQRARLSGLMRYCSGRRIQPASVNDTVLDAYLRYRADTTALASDNTARRSIARTWNECAGNIEGWPAQLLTEPPVKAKAGPDWDDFPEGLRRDIEVYLAGLQKMHRDRNGKRIRLCSASTIGTRRAELPKAVGRKAVELGVPIKSLTSLAAFLHPDVVERVIDAYWRKNGNEPKVFTIELGGKLLRIARETGCLDEKAIGRLDDIRAALEHHRSSGLTGKNLKVIRLVLTDGIWGEVISLPNVLMQLARAANHAPIRAAIMAQLAVAIAILTFAPVRLGNLVQIKIGENLIKPGRLNSPYRLVFPHHDVKNRVDLDFLFDDALTELIDEYVHEFRPALLRGSNACWLFPGVAGEPKTANMFSTQITQCIKKATGLRITAHQFRHAAAAIYLKHRPGDYETVRRLLGHRNINTTTSFYVGLETTQATVEFGKIVRQQMKFDAETA